MKILVTCLFVTCLGLLICSSLSGSTGTNERELFRLVFDVNGPVLAHDETFSFLKQLADIYRSDQHCSASKEDQKLVFDLIGITQMMSCTEENSRNLQLFIKENVKQKRSKSVNMFVDTERRKYNKRCEWL